MADIRASTAVDAASHKLHPLPQPLPHPPSSAPRSQSNSRRSSVTAVDGKDNRRPSANLPTTATTHFPARPSNLNPASHPASPDMNCGPRRVSEAAALKQRLKLGTIDGGLAKSSSDDGVVLQSLASTLGGSGPTFLPATPKNASRMGSKANAGGEPLVLKPVVFPGSSGVDPPGPAPGVPFQPQTNMILKKELETLRLASKKLEDGAGKMSNSGHGVIPPAVPGVGTNATTRLPPQDLKVKSVDGLPLLPALPKKTPVPPPSAPPLTTTTAPPIATKETVPTALKPITAAASNAIVVPPIAAKKVEPIKVKQPPPTPAKDNGGDGFERKVLGKLFNGLMPKRSTSMPTPQPPGQESDAPTQKRVFNLLDFEIREQIGKGAFACVHIVTFRPRRDSGNTTATKHHPKPITAPDDMPSPSKGYAMKSLRKADIVATKQVQHVRNEKDLLSSIRHPFIVGLVAAFQDAKHLYMVLEYAAGGDMFTHLRKFRRFDENVARFYTAELLLAIEFIHSKNITYRDLKPENILLDTSGHVKLADFGFSRTVPDSERLLTFCGTPAYMAPEVILKLGYTRAVDWWSLAIVCYEFQAGYSPFLSDSAVAIYEKIIEGDMRWSSQIQGTSKEFLSAMLQMSPSKRLGFGGAAEIKAHAWFRGVNWQAVERRQVPVPFVPTVHGERDVANFDVYAEQSSVVACQSGMAGGGMTEGVYDDLFKDF
ncbi:serine/threonine protein kinase, AGC [Irineochytrium annulatum]|nr:serine/threonine protein kinase, AGC [Irineochytrium annulatum]